MSDCLVELRAILGENDETNKKEKNVSEKEKKVSRRKEGVSFFFNCNF